MSLDNGQRSERLVTYQESLAAKKRTLTIIAALLLGTPLTLSVLSHPPDILGKLANFPESSGTTGSMPKIDAATPAPTVTLADRREFGPSQFDAFYRGISETKTEGVTPEIESLVKDITQAAKKRLTSPQAKKIQYDGVENDRGVQRVGTEYVMILESGNNKVALSSFLTGGIDKSGAERKSVVSILLYSGTEAKAMGLEVTPDPKQKLNAHVARDLGLDQQDLMGKIINVGISTGDSMTKEELLTMLNALTKFSVNTDLTQKAAKYLEEEFNLPKINAPRSWNVPDSKLGAWLRQKT